MISWFPFHTGSWERIRPSVIQPMSPRPTHYIFAATLSPPLPELPSPSVCSKKATPQPVPRSVALSVDGAAIST